MMLGRITRSLSIYCGRYEITHCKKGVWASKTLTGEGKTIQQVTICYTETINRKRGFKLEGKIYFHTGRRLGFRIHAEEKSRRSRGV